MFGLSALGAIIAAAITFLGSALTFLQPLFSMVLKFIEWFLSKAWIGLGIIATNLITLFVIVPLMLGSGYYGHKKCEQTCETKTITKLRTQYKFVDKKPSNPSKTSGSFFENWKPLGGF
jgi:membrane protein insertase Oxa1/YidC/SpoIIIJ